MTLGPREVARSYLERGWAPIPVPFLQKIPVLKSWQKLRITLDDLDSRFNGAPQNIGVLMGEPSNGLIDVDLDALEAVSTGDYYLPSTGPIFGRASKPRSHYLYLTNPVPKTTQFLDPTMPDGDHMAMILEVRATGAQTVFPGSVHEKGEAIVWNSDGEPFIIDGPGLLWYASRAAAAALLARHWPNKGGRHAASLALSGGLLRAGWDTKITEEFIHTICVAADDDEIIDRVATVETTAQRQKDNKEFKGWPSLAKVVPSLVIGAVREWLGIKQKEALVVTSGFLLTDYGNAERLVATYGKTIRHCFAWKEWLIWNDTVWEHDETNQIERFAKATVRAIYAEATSADDETTRKALSKHATKSEADSRINAMIHLAASETGIPVVPSHLDSNPWLLNVANGTIDLRTGDLHEHHHGDLMTKFVPIVYEPDATFPLWNNFLTETTGGHPELSTFLQRAVGYSLTGDTREEKLFFVHGPSRTGKSTFLDAIKMILGTYGMTSDFTTFLAQDFSNSNGPRPDIARLAGARFVVSIEVDEGKQLAEGLVKSLTGGEKITTRFLFGREFEFLPAFKLWLSANVTPKARPDDDAIWNRIVRIPFTHVVPLEKRDPRIKLALRNAQKAGPAILAWAVKGCLEWQKSGLMIPAEVKSSSEGYRLEVDGLAGFIEDCCILEPGAWSWSSVLVDEYERWSRANNEKKTLRGRAFGERLKVRGCTAERREKGNLGASRGWSGIRLIDENV